MAQYSVGLVLSGGAARGFAHLGVLKALEEKEFLADFADNADRKNLFSLLSSAPAWPVGSVYFLCINLRLSP